MQAMQQTSGIHGPPLTSAPFATVLSQLMKRGMGEPLMQGLMKVVHVHCLAQLS